MTSVWEGVEQVFFVGGQLTWEKRWCIVLVSVTVHCQLFSVHPLAFLLLFTRLLLLVFVVPNEFFILGALSPCDGEAFKTVSTLLWTLLGNQLCELHLRSMYVAWYFDMYFIHPPETQSFALRYSFWALRKPFPSRLIG